jgi:hypothetical protein
MRLLHLFALALLALALVAPLGAAPVVSNTTAAFYCSCSASGAASAAISCTATCLLNLTVPAAASSGFIQQVNYSFTLFSNRTSPGGGGGGPPTAIFHNGLFDRDATPYNGSEANVGNYTGGETSLFTGVWNRTLANSSGFNEANCPTFASGFCAWRIHVNASATCGSTRACVINTTVRAENYTWNYTVSDATPPTLTFVSPTPANNTGVPSQNVLFNVTASETLTNATLEINGTNYTMAGSGTVWSRNQSFELNGAYQYRVYASDLAGNPNVTLLRVVHIQNALEVYHVHDNLVVGEISPLNPDRGTHRSVLIVWNDGLFPATLSQARDRYNASVIGALISSSPLANSSNSLEVVWNDRFLQARNASSFEYGWMTLDPAANVSTLNLTPRAATSGTTAQRTFKIENTDKKGSNIITQINGSAQGYGYTVRIGTGQTRNFSIRLASWSCSAHLTTAGITPNLTVRVPAGWVVTSAPGWALSGSTAAGWLLARTDMPNGFDDPGCGTGGFSQGFSFLASAPNVTGTQRYVFNTTLRYEDNSQPIIHNTTGEHLVIVVGPPLVLVAPDAANYSLCSTVFYRVRPFFANGTPADATINVTVVDALNATKQSVSGPTSGGIFDNSYNITLPFARGEWYLKAQGAVTLYTGTFIAGAGTRELWRILLTTTPTATLFALATNMTLNLTVYNLKGEGVPGLLALGNLTLKVDGTPVSGTLITDLGNGRYSHRLNTSTLGLGGHTFEAEAYSGTLTVKATRSFTVTP